MTFMIVSENEKLAKPHIETSYRRVRRDSCPLCKSHNVSHKFRMFDDRYGMPDDFDVMHCSNCGAFYLFEYLAEDCLPSLYRHYYAVESGQVKLRATGLMSRIRQVVRSTKLWSFIMGGVDLSAYINSGEAVLDVGCGFGSNIVPVRYRGASWVGIDVDQKVCSALHKAGEECFCGSLEEFSIINKQKFDVIIMSQIIEHVVDPIALINSARKLLSPTGRILVSCPNGASRYIEKYSQKWLHWHVPYHTIQFTPKALAEVACQAELKLEWCRAFTPPSWYLAQCRIRQVRRGDVNSFFGVKSEPLRWLLLTPLLRLFDYFHPGSGDALVASFRKQ